MLLDMILWVVMNLLHDVVIDKNSASDFIFGILSLFTIHKLMDGINDIFCRLTLLVGMVSSCILFSLSIGQTSLKRCMLLLLLLSTLQLGLRDLLLPQKIVCVLMHVIHVRTHGGVLVVYFPERIAHIVMATSSDLRLTLLVIHFSDCFGLDLGKDELIVNLCGSAFLVQTY